MDSFYDAPRRAPVPTQFQKFLPTPVVPEVSIICSSRTSINQYSAYNSWKTQVKSRTDAACILNTSKDNILRESHILNQSQNAQNTSQLLKKQVRFESPVLQQRPSLTYEPFNTRKSVTDHSTSVPIITNKPLKNCEKSNIQQMNRMPFNRNTFEQIYMANVPNRNLDLSLIDLPIKSDKRNENEVENQDNTNRADTCKTEFMKTGNTNGNEHENKENTMPRTYREFLETQKKIAKESKQDHNDSVTDIFNYKRKQFIRENFSDNTNSKGAVIEQNLTKPAVAGNTVASNVIINENFKGSNGINSGFPLQQPQTQFYENNGLSDFKQQGFQNYPKNFGHSPKCDRVTQTSVACTSENREVEIKQAEISKNDSEPTNRDLLKIIAQQNEQLLILQKQVAMLLNRDDQHHPKQIEAPPRHSQKNYLGEKCITSTQNENFRSPMQEVKNTPRKQRALSKFSIDLMTSFEVAIRPQHNKQNFINQEPKIQEITESESGIRDNSSAIDKYDKTLVDTSLHLEEPVKVREMCPSPEPSININMNDYDSSDDDEVSASEIGATFYRNLMGQVNDILRKAQVQTKGDYKEGQNYANKLKIQTMNRVKEATLKHLKNIGVTMGPIEERFEEVSSEIDGKEYNPTDISFAVKQLLLKYLPDDQLAKITYKQAQTVPFNKSGKAGIIPPRPEFSFASVEYMKKYNLISNNKDVKPRNTEEVHKATNVQKPEAPKILDITALKMQPKLL